jgi:hypothetical protein
MFVGGINPETTEVVTTNNPETTEVVTTNLREDND